MLPPHLAAFIIVSLLGQSHWGLCFFMNTGSLKADLSLFYVGENLTLHCHKNSLFDRSEIVFKIADDVVDQQFITRINDTYARLDKPVTSADWAEAYYYCYDSSQIGKIKIYTDYPPQNATDFGMVWLGKSDLTMSWKFGNISYKNSHHKVIRVGAEWRAVLNNGFGPWMSCDSSTQTTCVKNSFVDVDALISVKVTFTNVKRSEEVTTISPAFYVKEHGKPLPIELSNVIVLDSKSARLEVKADWAKLNYRVHYCAEVNGAENCAMTETGVTPSKTLTIANLHPSYSYTFRVQAKFNTGGYFSEDSNSKSVTMPDAAPTGRPGLTETSFYLDRTTCPKKDASATAYVYFEEVAKEHQNGEIQNYTANVTTNQRSVWVSTGTGTERTLKAENVDCQKGFTVSLYAFNKVGSSPASVLTVPSWNEDVHNRVKSLDLRVRVKDGKVTAEWITNSEMDDFTLLLYYCSKDAGDPNKCVEAIQWEVVNPLAGYHSLPLADGSMMFGAARMEGGMTTGIVPTNCIYSPDESVGQVIDKVQATGLVDRIDVSWQGQSRCDPSKRIVILNYVVQLCKEQQESDCRQYLVDGRQNRKELKDVEPDTTYTVKVQANTTSGLTGFTTSNTTKLLKQTGGLSGGQVAGIVSAALIVCIIVGALIFWCFKDRWNEKSRRFKPALPSNLMGVDNLGASDATENHANDEDNSQTSAPQFQQQFSDDSGIDQGSPPLSPSSSVPVSETTLGPISPGHGELLSEPLLVPSFTNPGLKSNDGMSNPSQEDDSSLSAYVGATNVLADDITTGSGMGDTPQPSWESNQQMAYQVSCDQPVLYPDKNHPTSFPVPKPGIESCEPLTPAGGKNTARSSKVSSREDGSLQTQEAGKDATRVKNPSSLEDHEKPTDLPSAYVRLSAAEPAADSLSQSLTHEDIESHFEDALEDASFDDVGQMEMVFPLPVSASIPEDKQLSCTDAIQSYVHLAPSTVTGEDEEPAKAVGHLCPAPESAPEDPAHHNEADTRMNPTYVKVSVHIPNVTLDPDATDVKTQVLPDLKKESHCPEDKATTLHSGYVSCSEQSTHGGDQNAFSWAASEEEGPASSSERVEVIGKPEAISSNGYVSLTSVPGAASLPDENHPLPATSSPETESLSSDSSCSIQSEVCGDSVGGDWQTGVKGMLDENGYVHIENSSDGKHQEYSDKDESNSPDKGVGSPDKSCGYVPWHNIPFNSDKNLHIDTGNCQIEQKQPPGYIRLDSGYVSPFPDVNCSLPWQGYPPTE